MIFKRKITISSIVSSEEIGVERGLVFKAFLVIGGEVGLVIVAGSSWGSSIIGKMLGGFLDGGGGVTTSN